MESKRRSIFDSLNDLTNTYMKVIKLFVAVVLLTLAVVMAPQLSAQESSNKDENGKIVRGPYVTNKFQDNWFAGVATGLNFFAEDGFKASTGFNLDATIGKWFLPTLGARIGYSGVTGGIWSNTPSILGSEQTDKGLYKYKFGYAYFHADAMINLSNVICGYKSDRFWNCIPYAHTGIMLTYGRPSAVKFYDRELAVGLGLLNTFHLYKCLDITFDLRSIFVRGEQHAAVGGLTTVIQPLVGVSVNLGRTDWVRAKDYHNPSDTDLIEKAMQITADLEARNVSLKSDNVKLVQENEKLKAEVAELSKRPIITILGDLGPTSVYFEKGKDTLSQKELQHLDFYLQCVLPNLSNEVTISLTSCAEMGKQRVDYVQNLLTTKYGVNPSRIKINTQGAKGNDAAQKRAVVISFE